MKTIIAYILPFLFFVGYASAQTNFQLQGNIPKATAKEIRLMGYLGIKDTLLATSSIDALGNFTFTYTKNYKGAALLQIKDLTSFIVLLNNENFSINWLDLTDFNTLLFKNSKENLWLQNAYNINATAQKKLQALEYLLLLYKNDAKKISFTNQIISEITTESSQFNTYLNQLPQTSYAKDYLSYRVVLQKLQKKNKTKDEEAAIEKSIATLDFSSTNLYHSGLVIDVLGLYVGQILTSGIRDEVILKLNAFSDTLKKSSQQNSIALNNYSEYLIKEYEKYGLVACAEHLALSLLDDSKCIIDSKILPILEQYKKMAIGQKAPNVVFSNTDKQKALTDLKAKYKIVVFGASWCEACKQELPQMKEYAEVFKTKYDATIVFISLDTDKEAYNNFVKDFPFISDCDFKSWEGESVKNYCVFATPSLFILNENNTILAKPSTAVDTAKWLFENVN